MPSAPGSAPALPRPAPARTPVRLGELAAACGGRLDGDDVGVTGVTAASAQVRPGDLFAAVPGRSAHGARYVPDAVAAGAVAVLTDAEGVATARAEVPFVVVEDVRASLGPVAAAVYGQPSRRMAVLGVTGTSGKTTTAYLLRAGLAAAGRTPGTIGTVGTLVGDQELDTGFTTPEAPELQALLAVMAERGVSDVAMEVSSHALALHRVDGIEFAVAGFTNLTQDHLDFHRDMDDYFEAKARLFDGRARSAVVCVDDEWGQRLADRLGAAAGTVSATGRPADWRAGAITSGADGRIRFRVDSPSGSFEAGCAVPGEYNVANVLVALAMLERVGVPVEVAVPAVAAATVPGRMERIDAGQPFLAVVDYSHKPAAVAGALHALRPLTEGRLAIVLGCGGDRDRAKRPMMGQIAARDADLLVVTDDNPRSEDPALIRAAMLEGARSVAPPERAEVVEQGDRARAIAYAVAWARPGDTVLVAGKGHETGQQIGDTVTAFDDREVLRSALTEVQR